MSAISTVAQASASAHRVLIVQQQITHYRVPVFAALGRRPGIELSVLHSGTPMASRTEAFSEILVPSYAIGGFHWQRGVFTAVQAVDVVIAMFDLHWLSNVALATTRRRPRLIYWGHGIGRNVHARRLRLWLARRADAVLFYGEAGRRDSVRAGLSHNRTFVAPNTLFVARPGVNEGTPRRHFLFVGRLQVRKRLDHLIWAIGSIRDRIDPEINLCIVGDGDARSELERLAARLGVADRVHFLGEVTREQELKALFDGAIAYVSPGHVGLGVLHSFAYGVPVITARNARQGPEAENIQPEVNGILYDDDKAALASELARLARDPELARKLGRNAFARYANERQPEQMVSGFEEAIAYSVAQDR